MLKIIGITVIMMTLFLGTHLTGESSPIVLEEIGRPVNLDLDHKQLYILENHRIHIYSLKDFKRVKSFGKKGQGPGEFQTLGHVHITLDCSTDKLIVGSIRKISYFSKKGELLNEVKGKNLALRLVYLDEQDGKPRFLGWSQRAIERFNYNTIVVFDYELNKLKELYKEKDPFQGPGKGYDMLTKSFSFTSHQGRIFIPGKDNRSVDLLDLKLNPERTISVQDTALVVSDTFKKNITHFLKTSPETKNVFPMIRPLRFPKYFPLVNQFFADQGKLYIMSWEKLKKGNAFNIYDMNGKFIEKKYIPIQYETDTQPYPLTVKNGVLYQLVENESEGEWELLRRKI